MFNAMNPLLVLSSSSNIFYHHCRLPLLFRSCKFGIYDSKGGSSKSSDNIVELKLIGLSLVFFPFWGLHTSNLMPLVCYSVFFIFMKKIQIDKKSNGIRLLIEAPVFLEVFTAKKLHFIVTFAFICWWNAVESTPISLLLESKFQNDKLLFRRKSEHQNGKKILVPMFKFMQWTQLTSF